MIRLSFFRPLLPLFLSLAYCIGSVPLSAQEAESTDFLLPEMEAVFSETRGMIDHTLKDSLFGLHAAVAAVQQEHGHAKWHPM